MTRHVVLVTYGEPPRPAFLSQLRYSWRILLGLTRRVADIPPWLMPLIAIGRAQFRARLWAREHYTSPLEPITRSQAQELAAALASLEPGAAWGVHVAYEFRDPLLPDLLDRLPAGEPVDILPMYLADSAFTHEISRAAVRGWTGRRNGARAIPPRVLAPLDPQRIAELSADFVASELDARGIGGRDWALALAAHGTLLDPPRPMETGHRFTECVAAAITERLADHFGLIVSGWLNHVYGGRWTEPSIETALRRIAEAGYRRVVYFPFGFCADNAESELEGRLALRARSELAAVHLPCLNADARFMAVLARHVAGTHAPGIQASEPRREA